MSKTYKEYLSIALILAIIGVLGVIFQKPWQVSGSVTVGNQYRSTTTPALADLTNLCPAKIGSASSTTGVLGSVVITGPNVGGFQIYDATTSDATKRTNVATSSALLADFHRKIGATASTTAGTYTYDSEFRYGLFVDYETDVSTSTITYRCES